MKNIKKNFVIAALATTLSSGAFAADQFALILAGIQAQSLGEASRGQATAALAAIDHQAAMAAQGQITSLRLMVASLEDKLSRSGNSAGEQVAALEQRVHELEVSIHEKNAAFALLAGQKKGAEDFAAWQKEMADAAKVRAAAAGEQIDELQKRVHELEASIHERNVAFAELTGQKKGADDFARWQKEMADAAKAEAAAAKAEADAARADERAQGAERSARERQDADNRLQQIAAERDSLHNELREKSAELSQVQQSLAAQEADFRGLREISDNKSRELSDMAAAREALSAQVRNLEIQTQELMKARDMLQTTIADLTARNNTLQARVTALATAS